MPLLPEGHPRQDIPGRRITSRRAEGRRFARPPHRDRRAQECRPVRPMVVATGRNRIIAGAYGPREVHPRHLAQSDTGILQVQYRMSTFSVGERKTPVPGRREKEISMVIQHALEPVLFLEQYPNSTIDIFIQVHDRPMAAPAAQASPPRRLPWQTWAFLCATW